MLKNFLYLNSQSVDNYLSSLEDGLRDSAKERSTRLRSTEKGGDTQTSAANSDETTYSKVDTATARFERLQAFALANAQTSGWIQVDSPSADLQNVRTGSLIDIECEIYVPSMIQALSPNGGVNDMIGMLRKLSPFMDLGNNNMPAKKELELMETASGMLGEDLVLVGENDDTEWRVAGRLFEQYREGEIEGIARVVGKVTTSWGSGRWKPLLSLPGMNIMGREQRRAMERQQPTAENAETSLEGPAYMLDILAVYR